MAQKYFILSVIVWGCIQDAFSSVAVVDIKLNNLMKMQLGLGWPHTLHVANGHEALLKLGRSLPNPESCIVTSPSGETFDVQNPPSNRFEKWSDECGVRVRNAVKTDEGRWRLNATRGSESVSGWTEVFVEEDTPTYTPPQISLQDGQNDTAVDLSSLENSYCLVAQPFSESTLISGHCQVTLEKTTRAVQGNWNVLLGIPGRVQELSVQRHVTVESERLDVGYVQDTAANKLHLYCNILHTSKNITFCRFQKTNSASGYNVIDGLSDGIHSYYGDGFIRRQCGMTIEQPTSQDYGTWRCSVGVQQWIDNAIRQQSPMQALISVTPTGRTRPNRDQLSKENGLEEVFVKKDNSFIVMCRADVSLKYCWFQHPNGTQFTPVPIVNEEQEFWYTGESLQTGDCGITFNHASEEEEGEWICHMGPRDQLGVEITDRVNVRVTGSLAANKPKIEANVGEEATLHCHTSNGNRPLEYCRFLSPSFVGFSIDSSVTNESAILDRFYFTPGRDINHGDCSLTINPITEEDIGEWTCAALINEDREESRDTIRINVTILRSNRRFVASAVGISVGLIVLLVALAGFLVYRKQGWRFPRFGNQAVTNEAGMVTFDTLSNNASTMVDNGSRSSMSSDEAVRVT